jgi:hypothetical protein
VDLWIVKLIVEMIEIIDFEKLLQTIIIINMICYNIIALNVIEPKSSPVSSIYD